MNTLRCERTRRGTCAASPCLLLDRRAWNGVARHHRDGSLFWAPSSGKDTLYPASCRIVLYIERERERGGYREVYYVFYLLHRSSLYICMYIYIRVVRRSCCVITQHTPLCVHLSPSLRLLLDSCFVSLPPPRIGNYYTGAFHGDEVFLERERERGISSR